MIALQYAVKRNKPHMIQLLLENGAATDCVDNYGWTPLRTAIRERCMEAAKVLLDWAGYQTAKNNWDHNKAFIHATRCAELPMVELLLQYGADPDAVGPSSTSPLLITVLSVGQEALAYVLLKYGARFDIVYGEYTPLLLAALKNCESVVAELLAKDLDIEFKGPHGRTALSWAAQGRNPNIVRLLLNKNANIETRDQEQLTPLAVASQADRKEIVHILVELGADVNCNDTADRTPLILAAQNGHEETIEYLLRNSAQVDHWDLVS